MKTMTKNEIWSVLQQAALVQGPMPVQEEKHAPWFVRAMMGIAGWLGALFLVGFVVAGLAATIKEATAFWIMGFLACACTTLLFHTVRQGDFLVQFGLAVAIAGEILMTFGVAHWFEKSGTTIAVVIAVQQVIVLALMPNFLHRVWAAGTAALAFYFALDGWEMQAFALPLLTALMALAWLREFDYSRQSGFLRATSYGLALVAMFISFMHSSRWFGWLREFRYHSNEPSMALLFGYVASVLTFAVIIVATALLLQRERVEATSGTGKAALALAIVLALASVKAPGLAPASVMLLLGFANGNRVLTGLGVVALLAYLSHYYYALHATLLEKSVLMLITGATLLALRFASHRWWPALHKEVTTHA